MPDLIVQQIPLDKIDEKQVREHFDEDSIIGLAHTMAESGLITPITVTANGDRYILVAGGRRVRAARKAGWKTIAGIVRTRELTRTELLLPQMLENAQREDLRPLEKAKATSTLMKESGWSASEVAKKLGLLNATITRLPYC